MIEGGKESTRVGRRAKRTPPSYETIDKKNARGATERWEKSETKYTTQRDYIMLVLCPNSPRETVRGIPMAVDQMCVPFVHVCVLYAAYTTGEIVQDGLHEKDQ